MRAALRQAISDPIRFCSLWRSAASAPVYIRISAMSAAIGSTLLDSLFLLLVGLAVLIASILVFLNFGGLAGHL